MKDPAPRKYDGPESKLKVSVSFFMKDASRHEIALNRSLITRSGILDIRFHGRAVLCSACSRNSRMLPNPRGENNDKKDRGKPARYAVLHLEQLSLSNSIHEYYD